MQVRKNFFSTTRENRLIHYSVDTESVETVKSKVLNLSEAIEKIKVSEAIASLDKEIPKQKLLDTCFKNLLKSYLYLEFLSTIHSSEHQGFLENCSESVIMHDYNIPTLTRMYEQVDSISLKDMDCNVTQLFFSLRERLMGKNMKIYKISEAGVEAYQQSHLQSTLTKRKIQKQRKSYSERHEKLKNITDRLNDPDYLLYLSKNLIIEADSSDSRKYEELDFKYQEHKSIKAMDELLADECKQKSKQKQLPPLVSSSKKSRKKKGHLSRDTQRPIKTADRKESMPQTSNFQLSEKELNPSHCLIKQKTIKVHPRVRRWANVNQDSIKNIRDWSYESNQFVYNYSNHENPEFLIATHDLSNISRVLESNLSEKYGTPYRFVDKRNIERHGIAYIASMVHNDTRYDGTIFAGIGEADNILYHAHFLPMVDPKTAEIDHPTKHFIQQLRKQIKSIECNRPKDVENEGEFHITGKITLQEENAQNKQILEMETNHARFFLTPR